MFNRRVPQVLPCLYAEDVRVGAQVRVLLSLPGQSYPTVTLVEALPDQYWRVQGPNNTQDIVHVSFLASTPTLA